MDETHGKRVFQKAIRVPEAEDPIFQGHFDQAPIVPGVVLLQWAIEFATQSIAAPLRFQSVEQLKFRRVVQPGMQLQLLLTATPTKADRFEFRYLDADKEIASGRVLYRTRDPGLRDHSVLPS